jgi:hypothetical protein
VSEAPQLANRSAVHRRCAWQYATVGGILLARGPRRIEVADHKAADSNSAEVTRPHPSQGALVFLAARQAARSPGSWRHTWLRSSGPLKVLPDHVLVEKQ